MTEYKERTPKKPTRIISKFNTGAATLARNTKHVIVKNKKLKPSSKRWLDRHINDEYTTKALQMGYRAQIGRAHV